jgi:uncharacterized protein (TIGR03000 family)
MAGTGGHGAAVGFRGPGCFGPFRGYGCFGGFRGYGWCGYPGFGFYGGGFGYYPYAYGYYPYAYPGYWPPGIAPVPVPQQGVPPTTDNRCHLHVEVPADATLWVGSEMVSKTGPVRDLVSPQIAPGQPYAYTLRARWTQAGQTVEQTGQVTMQPNQTATIRFGPPPQP